MVTKKSGQLVKSTPITVEINEYELKSRIESAIDGHVSAGVDEAVLQAVTTAVEPLVAKVGLQKISKAVDEVLEEGWQITDEYGQPRTGKVSLKDRVSKILSEKNSYSGSRSWLDELIKKRVDEVVNKDLKADIDAARAKFKAEVDSVLTGVIKKAVAEHFGVKQ